MECAFHVGEWRVDPASDTVSRNEEVIKLEPRTMQVLVRLAQSPAQVVSSQYLLDTVWDGVVVSPASVYQAISQLRKTLGDVDAVPSYIATVPRKGYRLIAPVKVATPETVPPPSRPAAPPTASARASEAVRNRTVIGVLLAIVVGGATSVLVLRDRAVPEPRHNPTIAPPSVSTLVLLPITPASEAQAAKTIAGVTTDLLRSQLTKLGNVVVVSKASTEYAMSTTGQVAEVLHGQYMLKGHLGESSGRLQLHMSLDAVTTGSTLWSRTFSGSSSAVATLTKEVVRQTAESLRTAAVNTASGHAEVDLTVYELYLRGRDLMSTFRVADARQATAIFSRVTTLEPSFARAYCAYAEALLLAADLGAWNLTQEVAADADRAIERALELDSRLGEAWAQRARLTENATAAEEFYRRAIELAPSYDEAYIHYSDLLFSQRRRGEALVLIDRARRIDPFSAALTWRQSQLVLAVQGDVDKHDRLLAEALRYKPTFVQPLRDLAFSKGVRQGQFAEGIRYIEQAIALDPDSIHSARTARILYLDVDDPASALAVLEESSRRDDPSVRAHWVAIAQYRHDRRRAAELARELIREWLVQDADFDVISRDRRMYSIAKEFIEGDWPIATALRDEAIATGDFRESLELLGQVVALQTENTPMRLRGVTLTYAHMLMLAGAYDRARALLTPLLEHLEAEAVGRPEGWSASTRAAAFAILGEDERAIEELTASVARNELSGWWYTASTDPVYARTRDDPRFQALVQRSTQHRREQRARLEEMRRRGEVRRRA